MIVTCEQCTTQFKLDDAKVPEGGARVRCSRCKHAFFIQPPGQEDDMQAAGLAQEALEAARDSAPPRVSDAPPAEEGESDWEFNDDPGPDFDPEPAEGPADFAAARAAVDDLLGEGDLDPVAPPLDEPLPPPERIELAAPEPAPVPPPDPAPVLPISPIVEPAPPAPPPELPAPERASPTRNDLEAELDGAVEETESGLGSPEEWDFFEQETAPTGTRVARVPLVPRWKLQQEEALRDQADGGVSGLEAASNAEIDPGLGREPGRTARVLRQAAHAVGWCVTLALLGLGIREIAMPPIGAAARADAGEAASQQLGALRAEEVRGRWVERVAGGPLYVVSGRVRNATSSPVEVGSLGVRLLDSAGRPLEGAAQPLSLPFARVELREADAGSRTAAAVHGAETLANLRLMPAVASGFEAVFEALPEAAARFRLEEMMRPAPIPAEIELELEPAEAAAADAP